MNFFPENRALKNLHEKKKFDPKKFWYKKYLGQKRRSFVQIEQPKKWGTKSLVKIWSVTAITDIISYHIKYMLPGQMSP